MGFEEFDWWSFDAAVEMNSSSLVSLGDSSSSWGGFLGCLSIGFSVGRPESCWAWMFWPLREVDSVFCVEGSWWNCGLRF